MQVEAENSLRPPLFKGVWVELQLSSLTTNSQTHSKRGYVDFCPKIFKNVDIGLLVLTKM